MNRLLRYINIIIAICLVAVLGAVWWYAFRPLPKASGSVRTGVATLVTVVRDSLGVPHISAETEEDAWFAQGYVTAQDRFWQMDMLRRVSLGELSEIVGTAGIESDRDSRVTRMRRIAEAAAQALPEAERRAIAAYAGGVNAYIDTHLDKLPIEFSLLRYDPRPWRISDSLAVGLLMIRTLTTSWPQELVKRDMLQAGNPVKVQQLFSPPTTIEPSPGSNAWALAGSRTQSGKPLLASDMHLEISMPSRWYLVHLRSPQSNVSGVSLPGIPGVIAGHNDQIAWGMTNLHFDVQDLYLERFDANTGRYFYRGNLEQARAEQEIIRVRGTDPISFLVWVTQHGPIVRSGNGEHLALRWAPADTAAVTVPFLAINRAKSWSEFRDALATFPGPAQNFVFADAAGNIGYQVAGKLPMRRHHGGDTPVDGSSGAYEWDGFIPFEELPYALNPEAGLIVSANQNPFPEQYAHTVTGSFAPPYRSRQIQALLERSSGWNSEMTLKAQIDVYSAFNHFLAQSLVAAFDARKPRNERLPPAVQLLRGWNGQMEKDDAAPLIVTLASEHLRRAIAESAAPGKGASYQGVGTTAAIERLLRSRPAGWFRDWNEALLRALEDGLDEGSRRFGRDPARWKYGSYSGTALRHPLGARIPWYVEYPLKAGWLLRPWIPYANFTFDIDTFPQSGSSTTVKQTTQRMMPSMRMVVDFGDLEASLINLPTGQSGQIASEHYKDQFSAHYYGRSFRMQFDRVEAHRTLRLEPFSQTSGARKP